MFLFVKYSFDRGILRYKWFKRPNLLLQPSNGARVVVWSFRSDMMENNSPNVVALRIYLGPRREAGSALAAVGECYQPAPVEGARTASTHIPRCMLEQGWNGNRQVEIAPGSQGPEDGAFSLLPATARRADEMPRLIGNDQPDSLCRATVSN